MNAIAQFRKCTLSDDELLKAVDNGCDKMYQDGKIPDRQIPARPNDGFDLLVGELILRFEEQKSIVSTLQEEIQERGKNQTFLANQCTDFANKIKALQEQNEELKKRCVIPINDEDRRIKIKTPHPQDKPLFDILEAWTSGRHEPIEFIEWVAAYYIIFPKTEFQSFIDANAHHANQGEIRSKVQALQIQLTSLREQAEKESVSRSEVINLLDYYWRFDSNQQQLSSWHDKQDLMRLFLKPELKSNQEMDGLPK